MLALANTILKNTCAARIQMLVDLVCKPLNHERNRDDG
jgi:hypothetical protein